jgi:hypothetical protein
MKRLVQLCVLFALCQGCVSNSETNGAKENTFRMPGSLLQVIRQAVRNGNFSCDKKVLSSRDFFELPDGRLLILVGIPDYLCASNSFMPVIVDSRGRWLAGPILPGAPSLLALAPDNSLWLAAQWQIEGTFPALYRSTNGADWTEIKLPENRGVDCCFERLERICFHRGAIRLKFAGSVAGKTAYWEADLDRREGIAPVWKAIANAGDDASEIPCSSVALDHGSWIRKGPERSGEIIFQKSERHYKISVAIPYSLE